MLIDTEYDSMSPKDYAKHFGVSERTIFVWNKKIDWNWVREQRKVKYAKALRLVDSAMVKKAQKGDVRAAELVYQLFGDWVPASKQFTTHDIDESRVDEELKKLMERKGAVADALQQPVGPGGRDEAKVPDPAQVVPQG